MAGNDESIFDPLILRDLGKKCSNGINTSSLFTNNNRFQIRPLAKGDYFKGYIKLLSLLTKVGEVTEEMFLSNFDKMRNCAETYYICVVEDIQEKKIAATGTLFIEKKFIHSCHNRGRIEDIVVSDEYRQMKFGKMVVYILTALSQVLDCYKITLDCKPSLVPFYEKNGYKLDPENNYMVIRYKD